MLVQIELESEDQTIGIDVELPEGMSLKDLRAKIVQMLEAESIEELS